MNGWVNGWTNGREGGKETKTNCGFKVILFFNIQANMWKQFKYIHRNKLLSQQTALKHVFCQYQIVLTSDSNPWIIWKISSAT